MTNSEAEVLSTAANRASSGNEKGELPVSRLDRVVRGMPVWREASRRVIFASASRRSTTAAIRGEVSVMCSIWSTLHPERSTRKPQKPKDTYLYGYRRAPFWGYRALMSNEWQAAVTRTFKAERAASGMTINELAARSGLSRSTIARFESGSRAMNTDQLAAICAALGLRMSEFLRRAEERVSD